MLAELKPELHADGKAVVIEICGDKPRRWCADDVPLLELELELGGRGPRAKLVGPDVVVVANGQTDAHDPELDPFIDAVLVGGPKGYRCSGVLLDALHVLTAGHCAPATHIGLGASAEVARQVAVADSVIHPSSDVAVLRLAAPVPIATHGRRLAMDTAPPVGRIRVLGFGVRDPLRFTGFGTRRQVDLLVNGWGCQPLRAALLGCHPGLEMHAHDVSGNDTCFGDSGGPVFEATADGWRLIAITSRGAQPRRVMCGEGGIYVRVDSLAPWLQEVLQ